MVFYKKMAFQRELSPKYENQINFVYHTMNTWTHNGYYSTKPNFKIDSERTRRYFFGRRNSCIWLYDYGNTNKSTPDLSLARSYLSIFNIIPQLDFFIDDSLDYLENIEKLLKS